MKLFFLFAFLLLASPALRAESHLADIQRSHIEANVPSPEVFAELLKHDLLEFFRKDIAKTATTAKYRLLRDGPTQSGVSYPKYYLWVTLENGSTKIVEGAARVAAIEKKRFDVTHFMSKEQIQSQPEQVRSVFPPPLVASILSAAGAK